MKKVYICEMIHPAAVEYLAERMEIVSRRDQVGEADALISRAFPVDAALMDRMPRLKVIAAHGTGVDGIDLAEARRRGIRVVNAPHLNANAVAELNVGLLLAVLRRIVLARKILDTQDVTRPETERIAESQEILRGFELRGKTAGFIGFGAIGSRTAEILAGGFGMSCIAWSPSLTEERAARGRSRCAASPEEVLAAADAVFLAMPLTDASRNFMNRERLAAMKEGSILVNASRGGLVDEEALYDVLASGRLGGAAADVLKEEFPRPDHPLLTLPNFVDTPHVGASTEEALRAVGMACARQIVTVLDGGEPEYPVV